MAPGDDWGIVGQAFRLGRLLDLLRAGPLEGRYIPR